MPKKIMSSKAKAANPSHIAPVALLAFFVLEGLAVGGTFWLQPRYGDIGRVYGIALGVDDDARPAVRGSAPDDNLYLIDDIPAAYVFHLFGDSIFSENTIRSFKLHPAAFGSRYGGATGAIIDVRLRDPSPDERSLTLDYSLLRTGVFIETGLGDRQALYAGYRRSLIDLYLDTGDEEEGVTIRKPPVSTDYQLKHVTDLGSSGRLSLLAMGASDKAAADFSESSEAAAEDPDFAGPAQITRRFDSQGIDWTRALPDRDAEMKLLLAATRQTTDFDYGSGQFIQTRLERWLVKGEYGWLAGDHGIRLGLELARNRLGYALDAKIPPCSDLEPDCSTIDAPRLQLDDARSLSLVDAFIEDQWQGDERWLLTGGLHLSADDYLDETFVEPRLRIDYALDERWTLSWAAGRYHRFPAAEEVLPSVGNPDLESPRSTHFVFGVEHQWSGTLDWKLELYYKDMEQLVLSLREGIDADHLQRYSNDASGRAYGLELMVNRDESDGWYGWISLSLSRSERRNERSGETLPFHYDRPFMLNLVANHRMGALWRIGWRWRIQSGGLYTPIIALEESSTQPGVYKPVYGALNSERLPLYHRLDLHLERNRDYGWGRLGFYADLLNVYGQENVQAYSYSPNGSDLVEPPDGYAAHIPVTRELGITGFLSLGIKLSF
jgi:outer membrane receptor protein involved in Fe transport